MECLVLGCTGAGKSTLLNRLSDSSSSLAVLHPTVGTNVKDIYLSKRKCIRLREVSGSLRQTWPQYIADSRIVIYLVDLENRMQLSTCLVELLKLLSNASLESRPLLLLFNKGLSPVALTQTHVAAIFALPSILQHTSSPIKVLEADLSLDSSIEQISSWMKDMYGVR